MKRIMCLAILAGSLAAHSITAQEASSGVDLRATLTAQAVGSKELTEQPRNGAPVFPGGRILLYPTIKFNDNLYITSSLKGCTRPYYFGELDTNHDGAYGRVLQASLNYSRVSSRGSLLLRAGELSSAFGSYLLRYDDTANAVIDLAPGVGYYYVPVSTLGVAGAQIDATRGRFDGRLQFVNSSAANPRSIFARDQYGNWAGGGGYTIRQGLRVGVSGYRGPYLERDEQDFSSGGTNPRDLPAHGLGIDADWDHRHTHVWVELQRFLMPHHGLPNFHDSIAYVELQQNISPRWFVGGRYSYQCSTSHGASHTVESTLGFRPNRYQTIKTGYEHLQYRSAALEDENRFAVQLITAFHKSLTRN